MSTCNSIECSDLDYRNDEDLSMAASLHYWTGDILHFSCSKDVAGLFAYRNGAVLVIILVQCVIHFRFTRLVYCYIIYFERNIVPDPMKTYNIIGLDNIYKVEDVNAVDLDNNYKDPEHSYVIRFVFIAMWTFYFRYHVSCDTYILLCKIALSCNNFVLLLQKSLYLSLNWFGVEVHKKISVLKHVVPIATHGLIC